MPANDNSLLQEVGERALTQQAHWAGQWPCETLLLLLHQDWMTGGQRWPWGWLVWMQAPCRSSSCHGGGTAAGDRCSQAPQYPWLPFQDAAAWGQQVARGWRQANSSCAGRATLSSIGIVLACSLSKLWSSVAHILARFGPLSGGVCSARPCPRLPCTARQEDSLQF